MRLKSVVLVFGILAAVSLSAYACDKGNSGQAQATSSTVTTSFAVTGMHCGMCTAKVKEALSKVDGVSNVVVSLEDSRATVEYDPAKVQTDQLLKAGQSTGFAVAREVKEVGSSKLASEKSCSGDPKACSHMGSQLSSDQGKSCCTQKAKKGSTKETFPTD